MKMRLLLPSLATLLFAAPCAFADSGAEHATPLPTSRPPARGVSPQLGPARPNSYHSVEPLGAKGATTSTRAFRVTPTKERASGALTTRGSANGVDPKTRQSPSDRNVRTTSSALGPPFRVAPAANERVLHAYVSRNPRRLTPEEISVGVAAKLTTAADPHGFAREFGDVRLYAGHGAVLIDDSAVRFRIDLSPDGRILTESFLAKSGDGVHASALHHAVTIKGIENRADGVYVKGSIYAARGSLAIRETELQGAQKAPPSQPMTEAHDRTLERNGVHMTFTEYQGFAGTDTTGYGLHFGRIDFSTRLQPGQTSVNLGNLAGDRVEVEFAGNRLSGIEVNRTTIVPDAAPSSQ